MNQIIYKEDNPAKFNASEHNRDLKPTAVAELEASMKETGFWHWEPIVVDERGTVLSGHHRLQAARNLGIPVFYTHPHKKLSPKQLATTANQNTRWSPLQLSKLRARQNHPEHIKLQNFIENTGIAFSSAVALTCKGVGVTSRAPARRKIMDDQYEFEISKDSKRIIDYNEILRNRGYDWAGQIRPICAIASCLELVDLGIIDEGRFKDALKIKDFEPDRSTAGYINQFENAYNHKISRKKVVSNWYGQLLKFKKVH